MDEKTAELRDIFVETTGAKSTTESQAEQRGDLSEGDPGAVDERLRDLLGRLNERGGLGTELSADELVTLVRAFHDGDDDAAIADRLGADPATVFAARTNCHLVRERDRSGPADPQAVRGRLVDGDDPATVAAALAGGSDGGLDPDAVERQATAIAADRRSTRVNHRFRDAFAELLTDADLSSTHAAEAREDGLSEAAEDIETNVSF